jgi:hypothetical protein
MLSSKSSRPRSLPIAGRSGPSAVPRSPIVWQLPHYSDFENRRKTYRIDLKDEGGKPTQTKTQL